VDECPGKLQALVLRYLGGDCGATTNWQAGKVECDGDAGSWQPVRIEVEDGSRTMASPSDASIMIGDDITLVADDKLGANTGFDIVQGRDVIQSLSIHTSCSKPLAVGDRFGAMEVVAMRPRDGQHLSANSEVEYTYVVSNEGSVAVEHVTVADDVLGEISGSPIARLLPGEAVTLRATGTVTKTTTHVVRVSAVTAGGAVCSATDSTAVNVVGLPEVITITQAAYKANKDQLKVEATDTRGGKVDLTVVGYGEMDYDAGKDKYKLDLKRLGSIPPCSIEVVSSGGASATARLSGVPHGSCSDGVPTKSMLTQPETPEHSNDRSQKLFELLRKWFVGHKLNVGRIEAFLTGSSVAR
jgi:hypothetical protein